MGRLRRRGRDQRRRPGAAARGYFRPEEVRRETVGMLADSGSYYTALNEDDAHRLGLLPVRNETLLPADGSSSEVEVLEPIQIEFADRVTVCEAVLVPARCDSLLGAIAMEGMDLAVDPMRGALIPNPRHPEGHVIKMLRHRP